MSKETKRDTKRVSIEMDPFLARRIDKLASAMGVSFAGAAVALLRLAANLRDKDMYKSAKKELEKILP